MRGAFLLLILTASCRFDLPESDAPDAAAPRCDVTKPFGLPVLVEGVNSSTADFWGWPSADQLTLYFTRDSDLYVATRTQVTEPFSGVSPLAGVNTSNHERRPTLTADGLTLFWEFTNMVDFSIRAATRTRVDAAFSSPETVTAIDTAEGS